MPAGLHRCVTKTTYYNLKPSARPEIHARFTCGGCNRDFHVYRLDESGGGGINALLIVADPRCPDCETSKDFEDGPVEGDRDTY